MDPGPLRDVLDLHRKWLEDHPEGQRANLRGANLCGADLRGADLREADLRGANLRGANLIGTNLSWTNLRWTNLIEADLREADLIGANLIDASLRGADLSGADLRGADLSGADLRGADLSGAHYGLLDVLRMSMGRLSDALTLELMRQDALVCGEKAMNTWVRGGACPFDGTNQIRPFRFREHKEVWVPGPPEMNIAQIWAAVAKELNIKI
jgi:hypothetical protein